MAAILALLAAVLLAVGYFADVPVLGIAALVVSLAALALVLVTFFRRPSVDEPEDAPEAAPGPAPEPDVEPEPEPVAPPPPPAVPTADVVLVSPGRRRYHRPGCELIGDRETEQLTEEEAREEGFTACSRCAS